MQVGEHHQYLYKQSRQEFTVDAEIVAINGNEITIKFINPKGNYPHTRALRSAQDRARLVDYHIARPGAPNGNQNATKEGMHRIAFSVSIANERLERSAEILHSQWQETTGETLRDMVYTALDYLYEVHESSAFKAWFQERKPTMDIKLNTPISEPRREWILRRLEEEGYPLSSNLRENFRTLDDLIRQFDPTGQNADAMADITEIVNIGATARLDGLLTTPEEWNAIIHPK